MWTEPERFSVSYIADIRLLHDLRVVCIVVLLRAPTFERSLLTIFITSLIRKSDV